MTFGGLALIAGATFVVALAAPIFLIPVLRRMGVLDKPNARSLHSTVTVRGAGLATLVGVLVGTGLLLLTAEVSVAASIFVVAGAMVLISLVGAMEDWRGLPIAVRAGLQFGIGLLLAAGLVLLAGAPIWLIPIGGFAFAAYVNIANFMDGVNGISAFHGLAVGLIFALLAWAYDLTWLAGMSSIVAAAFAAFLPWNLGRGRVFLGDAGSYLLGGSIAALAITLLLAGVPFLAVLAPLSIYLVDTGFTLLRRIANGEKWYQSHREHVFQRITDFGVSHILSAGIVLAFTLLMSGLGILAAVTMWTWQTIAIICAGVAVLGVYINLPRLFQQTKSGAPVKPTGARGAIRHD